MLSIPKLLWLTTYETTDEELLGLEGKESFALVFHVGVGYTGAEATDVFKFHCTGMKDLPQRGCSPMSGAGYVFLRTFSLKELEQFLRQSLFECRSASCTRAFELVARFLLPCDEH